jgi:hypothetical protein
MTYGYDEAGNLYRVTRPKESKAAEIKDTHAYNGEGLRTSQTISGTSTFLAWDMTESLPLILSDGTNSYIYGRREVRLCRSPPPGTAEVVENIVKGRVGCQGEAFQALGFLASGVGDDCDLGAGVSLDDLNLARVNRAKELVEVLGLGVGICPGILGHGSTPGDSTKSTRR